MRQWWDKIAASSEARLQHCKVMENLIELGPMQARIANTFNLFWSRDTRCLALQDRCPFGVALQQHRSQCLSRRLTRITFLPLGTVSNHQVPGI